MDTTVISRQRLLLAQSLFPRLDCPTFLKNDSYREQIVSLVENSMAGGFVLFSGDVDMVAKVIDELRSRSDEPLLFAADCEDGVTMRFTGGTEFPSMMALGSSNDVAATYAVARSIAREMRLLGIGWNFAPVADINTNPKNPIINIRSFGEQADLVSAHVHAYVRGMQDGGVVACAKHFPGHGDTERDSHLEIPVSRASRKRLFATELVPFREAISNGVKSVMVSHVAVPSIDPSGAPATLSRALTHDLLRTELGFDGVVVTDAMEMHAISHAYGDGEAALLAYQAGCDVLEVMPDSAAALDALSDAADEGTIDSGRIEETARRIAALKEWSAAFVDDEALSRKARQGHDVIALEAARRSIRTSGSLRRIVPPLYVLAFVDDPKSPKPEEWFTYFSSWYSGEATGAIATPEVSQEDMEVMCRCIAGAGTLILALFVRPRGFAGSVGLSRDQEQLLAEAIRKPVTLLNFGNPYLLRSTDVKFRLDAFSASSASLAASIEVLSRNVK